MFRLRDLPGGGFTEISRFIWQKYRLATKKKHHHWYKSGSANKCRLELKLADQDVLNIVGAQAKREKINLKKWNLWEPRRPGFSSRFLANGTITHGRYSDLQITTSRYTMFHTLKTFNFRMVSMTTKVFDVLVRNEMNFLSCWVSGLLLTKVNEYA